MQKSATLSLRVDPEVKQSAETILAQLGIPMSTAVDMFLRQVTLTGEIPFRVALPEASPSVDAGSMTDGQIRDVLARGLRESEEGAGFEASAAFSRLREELFGA
ncbi:MAG: type II toxin-antitoxin system RelB/DinJ family antitoxin [Coriobacteriales bacterium]|nr:type II toxin-antitoxin system RelB/DinJ family antitoxin [Coriobacteriales bacterium]